MFGLPSSPFWETLAAVPQPALVHAVHQARLPSGDSLSAINATQVGVDVAAFKINFEDRDPCRTAMGDTAQAGQGRTEDRGQTGGSSVKEKVVKMSSLVDQMDESELLPDMKTVKKWHAQCIRVMGSMPDESEEPSAGQLVGLAKRMSGGGPPYVDFAVTVFLPYGRRSEESHKFRTYVPLRNGEIQVREQPGPSNFQAWLSSWRVFKCACIMLDILNLAALARYESAIEKMVRQWPSAWGLILLSRGQGEVWKMDETTSKDCVIETQVDKYHTIGRRTNLGRPYSACWRQTMSSGRSKSMFQQQLGWRMAREERTLDHLYLLGLMRATKVLEAEIERSKPTVIGGQARGKGLLKNEKSYISWSAIMWP